jgi:cytosine/adenosine deaminase-related metal-dependent hydrolase
VKVGLGTDVAGGYSPSMLSAIRNAVITHKVLSMHRRPSATTSDTEESFDYRHAFWLATMGSAEALGMEVSAAHRPTLTLCDVRMDETVDRRKHIRRMSSLFMN